MNNNTCKNCGASLLPVPANEIAYCKYCGSMYTAEQQQHVVRITGNGNVVGNNSHSVTVFNQAGQQVGTQVNCTGSTPIKR